MHRVPLVVLCVLLPLSARAELSRDAAVRALFADLLRAADYGYGNAERGAFLVLGADGNYRCELWPGGELRRTRFEGSIPRGTVAIVHTHPYSTPQVSADDQEAARVSRLPVYALTMNEIWMATPEGGKRAVERSARWADHAAIASLLVPPPTHSLVATLRHVLDEHNPLEDAAGGFYEHCDRVAADARALIARMEAIPAVRASQHLDEPRVHAHIERMLEIRATFAPTRNRFARQRASGPVG